MLGQRGGLLINDTTGRGVLKLTSRADFMRTTPHSGRQKCCRHSEELGKSTSSHPLTACGTVCLTRQIPRNFSCKFTFRSRSLITVFEFIFASPGSCSDSGHPDLCRQGLGGSLVGGDSRLQALLQDRHGVSASGKGDLDTILGQSPWWGQEKSGYHSRGAGETRFCVISDS